MVPDIKIDTMKLLHCLFFSSEGRFTTLSVPVCSVGFLVVLLNTHPNAGLFRHYSVGMVPDIKIDTMKLLHCLLFSCEGRFTTLSVPVCSVGFIVVSPNNNPNAGLFKH